jgi:hypothetical protein
VPKSPKGADGHEQQVRQSTLRAKLAHGCSRISTGVRKRPTGHITIQVTVTYAQRGHHILHRLNLRDDTHLPIIEQHYPQFLTLKKISQIPLTYACPNRRGQQFSFTRAEVERTHTQLVDAYRELGARTAPFEAPGQEVGLRFLGWLQEELEVLPTIMTGFMSFASLITCEGAVNALSREGCGHFEVFDQSDEGFERGIFQVEDPVLKRSAGALFDRMWGPHDRETVRERSDRAMDQVKVHLCDYMCGYVCGC